MNPFYYDEMRIKGKRAKRGMVSCRGASPRSWSRAPEPWRREMPAPPRPRWLFFEAAELERASPNGAGAIGGCVGWGWRCTLQQGNVRRNRSFHTAARN
jgi:hypothetical protein